MERSDSRDGGSEESQDIVRSMIPARGLYFHKWSYIIAKKKGEGKEKREKQEKKKGGREREKRGKKKEDVILITTNHFALGIQEGLCYTHISAITMRLMVQFTQSEDTNR